MAKENMKKTIIAYKQGGNWIVNIDGSIDPLHYSINSKDDVKDWLKEMQGNHYYEDYELEFA